MLIRRMRGFARHGGVAHTRELANPRPASVETPSPTTATEPSE